MNCYLKITTGLLDKLTINFSQGKCTEGWRIKFGRGGRMGRRDSTRRLEGESQGSHGLYETLAMYIVC